uniref:Uncharacterized protein n=1 Tax=Haptolina ericina TaxID=156174 RepID=A0A7S3EVJ9_9EUKA|mmetsp:Transcript_28506/g.64545  ORF Transcript_28506/g.64545 Transcript_28506/m.64545 type:complete len:521 (+) Transcript_28506:24-1586(+)
MQRQALRGRRREASCAVATLSFCFFNVIAAVSTSPSAPLRPPPAMFRCPARRFVVTAATAAALLVSAPHIFAPTPCFPCLADAIIVPTLGRPQEPATPPASPPEAACCDCSVTLYTDGYPGSSYDCSYPDCGSAVTLTTSTAGNEPLADGYSAKISIGMTGVSAIRAEGDAQCEVYGVNPTWGHLYNSPAYPGEGSHVRWDLGWMNDGVVKVRFYCDSCLLSPQPPTSPPLWPPLEPSQMASIYGDPHMWGAHGDQADFKGAHGGVYCLLSAKNLSINMKTIYDTFITPFSKVPVRGSWVIGVFHSIRTAQTGRRLQIFFHAADPRRAIITEGCTAPYCRDTPLTGHRIELKQDGNPVVIENVRVELRAKTLRVGTGQWLTTSASTVSKPHPNKLRMNVEMRPTYQQRRDPVAPHGLLGQSYDRDGRAVHGRRDDYSRLDDGRLTTSRRSSFRGDSGVITTRARAEGAIEGCAEDYRVASDFATAFRFSRFDAVRASTRNVSALNRSRAAAARTAKSSAK